MSPATIRSWISKGTLRAMRAGQRKWLVRRSELDRMLAGKDVIGARGSTRWSWLAVPRHDRTRRVAPRTGPRRRGSMFRAVGGSVSLRRNGARRSGRARWHLRTPGSSSASMRSPTPRRARRRRWRTSAARRRARGGSGSPGCPGASCPTSCDRAGAGRDRPSCGRGSIRRSTSSAVRWRSTRCPAEQHALEEVSLVLHEIVDALLEQEGRQWPVPIEEPGARSTRRSGTARSRDQVDRQVFRELLFRELDLRARLRPRGCWGSSASVRLTTRPPRMTRGRECG